MGTLTIDTTPVKGPIFVDGKLWGTAPKLGMVPVRSYTVSFGTVSGYETPPAQTVSVAQDKTKDVTGTYTVIPPPSPPPDTTQIQFNLFNQLGTTRTKWDLRILDADKKELKLAENIRIGPNSGKNIGMGKVPQRGTYTATATVWLESTAVPDEWNYIGYTGKIFLSATLDYTSVKFSVSEGGVIYNIIAPHAATLDGDEVFGFKLAYIISGLLVIIGFASVAKGEEYI